ncbi:MAG: efflux RND transporter permease subunit [Cyanomargarita calcarea GSE-NOS-MK-12-04C]|jgi:multidrug efflux pump subunit AcrB|uniref:Efflux RND transporter permease subunit n=1 Tax=Cyanomargarita calcarea GSE-NOS-MK-12-04C TaxID=2839659 RepID=A0A951QM18_9CYAN|nr:efflux RND transporter permease subunit [Cyanomargarita calcarea GSE-NOS-MK-12-04C]
MVEPIRKPTIRERFNISRLAIQYPWLTISFWLAILVAGSLAFSSLKYALFPDITFPVVVVNANAPLQTALDTEKQLTKVIEERVKGLQGLDDTSSLTYPGQSVVSLNFAVGTNLDESKREVERQLKGLKLPQGATFKVIPINLNEASVVSYAVESDSQKLEELSKTTKNQILPLISKLPGVLKVNFLGEPVPIDLTKPPTSEEGLGLSGTIVKFNGRDALAFQVVKRGDANTLEVVQEVNQAVKRLQTKLPNVRLTLATTQAEYIEAATRETIQALIEAIILSIIVILPFLWNWKATVISALAIPMSLLGTFIVMAIYGFNLETLTLLALAMVIGSIIDDAIVDVENISRHLEMGESPKEAAINATSEIGLTVTAATLTAVAVFLPVGTMGGVIGQFFKPFGITISAAMLTSMLVARTLSPLLAVYWLKPPRPQTHKDNTPSGIVQIFQNWMEGLNRSYRNLLRWSLKHRSIVVGIALLSFVAGLALIPLIPKGFIPKLDRGEFNITYTAPLPEIPKDLQALAAGGQTAPPAEIDLTQISPGEILQGAPQIPSFNLLEDSLKVAKQLDDFVRKSNQVETAFTVVGSRQGEPNKGTIYVKLKGQRTISTADLQDQFRKTLPKIKGVSTSVEDVQFIDTGGEKPVQVRIAGEDLVILNRAARDITARLEKIPGFVDVSSTGEANQGNDIFEIKRADRKRVAVISANLGQNFSIGEATDRAVAETKAVIPKGVTLELGGDSARVDEVLGSFGITLGLSVLCIILVLYFLFRSWIDTLVIFLSLPLSIVGAMVGLLVVQSDFGMISLIGIIFLLGLTNKNSILIVDYIKQLRAEGMSRTEAILEAGPVRLRPILMTTAATILGMVPLALGFGAGVELRSPMAVAIMGGLVTSTLLSLIVVPVIYDLLDDLRTKKVKKSGARS